MALHEFLCPEVFPETRRLRDDPTLFAHYPHSALMVVDFAANRLVHWRMRPTPGLMEIPLDAPDLAERLAQSIVQPKRSFDMIVQLREKGVVWGLANMNDCVPYAPELFFGFPVNILQYNRRLRDRTGVLWRLPAYFTPDSGLGLVPPDAPPVDTIPFKNKKSVVVWRGSYSSEEWRTPVQTLTVPTRLDDGNLAEYARWSPRARAVMLSLSEGKYLNCRFAPIKRQRQRRGIDLPPGPFEDRRRPPEWLLEHRYQLCLPGNDVATQLYWIINSNALAFKVESEFEVIPDYFLQPWVHYVPIRPDLADLRDKFDYCEANPDLCHAIIERAQAAYARILDPPLWAEAEQIVLDRLGMLA